MFNFMRKNKSKKFSRRTLWKNDISILIIDERWNQLFSNIQKPKSIIACEEKIKELLKLQSRIIEESKHLVPRKKWCMERIIELTEEAFDKNNIEAKNEMRKCESEINRINKRSKEIDDELFQVENRIKEANIELLNLVVNIVYVNIIKSRKRVSELDKLIDITREKLKSYIDEREQLAEAYNNVYSYFHDLLGAEELERLDQEFLKS